MGRMKQAVNPAWLENRQYQTILRLTNTIAFEFAPRTGSHFVSPFISETLFSLHYEEIVKADNIADVLLIGE